MSFPFFKVSRPKTPQEVARSIRDSLMSLDTQTVVEVKALEKVLLLFLSFLCFFCCFIYCFADFLNTLDGIVVLNCSDANVSNGILPLPGNSTHPLCAVL